MQDVSILRLEQVSKSFSRIENEDLTHALDSISFDISKNEFITIVGPSGCGKSTILRMIAGLTKPTQGKIFIHNKEISGADPNRGMVFQKPTLFPWLTVEKNIAFGLDRQKKTDKSAVNKMLELISLKKFKDDYPHQLSGGMAQRVALARTLINKPDILLLDEPLAALDAFTRMHMQDEILDIWHKQKSLAIMVSHDIDEAIYMSSKIIIMENNPGRVKSKLTIDLDYPRKRNSLEFMNYRNKILEELNFASKIQ